MRRRIQNLASKLQSQSEGLRLQFRTILDAVYMRTCAPLSCLMIVYMATPCLSLPIMVDSAVHSNLSVANNALSRTSPSRQTIAVRVYMMLGWLEYNFIIGNKLNFLLEIVVVFWYYALNPGSSFGRVGNERRS